MTIKDCIDIVDNIKPNQYGIRDKVMWISFIEEIIINEVLKTHEGYDGRYDDFEGYSEDKLSVTLIVKSPYDRLYTAFLKMKIDEANGETARYNNSAALYNTYMMEYRKHYNKTHMPLDTLDKRRVIPPQKAVAGLSDAEFENLKKEMTYILTEYFSNSISPDKLYEIVTSYAMNNTAMLKGKDGADGANGIDGYTPQKGIDYFTKADKAELCSEIVRQIRPIRSYITILGGADNWTEKAVKDSEGNVIGTLYGQVIDVKGVTANSKVDLQITDEQMVIFYTKDIAFKAENDNGEVTVYCVGNIPEHDYTLQILVTEVV